jgi:hypothetical protein
LIKRWTSESETASSARLPNAGAKWALSAERAFASVALRR